MEVSLKMTLALRGRGDFEILCCKKDTVLGDWCHNDTGFGGFWVGSDRVSDSCDSSKNCKKV